MSEMKDLKDRLRQLEERISEVSGKLDSVLKITTDLQKENNQLEEKLNEDEASRKEGEWGIAKITIAVGSIFGTITGFVVSYFMRAIETSSWFWFALALILLLGYYWLIRMIMKMERPRGL
jgi:FtsH-binding integral membrane protein